MDDHWSSDRFITFGKMLLKSAQIQPFLCSSILSPFSKRLSSALDICLAVSCSARLAVMFLDGIEYSTVLGNGLFSASLGLNGDVTCFFDVVVEV